MSRRSMYDGRRTFDIVRQPSYYGIAAKRDPMNDRRALDSAQDDRSARGERVARGVIAQYIHELADHDWIGSRGETSGDTSSGRV